MAHTCYLVAVQQASAKTRLQACRSPLASATGACRAMGVPKAARWTPASPAAASNKERSKPYLRAAPAGMGREEEMPAWSGMT